MEVGRSVKTNVRLVEFTAHKGGTRPEGRLPILDDDAFLFRVLRRHLFDVNLDLISGAIDRRRESHYVLWNPCAVTDQKATEDTLHCNCFLSILFHVFSECLDHQGNHHSAGFPRSCLRQMK
mgnify:FL=1